MPINKKLLTMEDANSILQHFTKGFIDYYTLDTRNLTTTDNLVSYDFVDIIRFENSITFKIKNDFWTKGYMIKDCNLSSYSVSGSGNEIEVTGTGLEWVVLCLELSSSFKHTNPSELEYIIEYTGRVRPFFMTLQLSFKCVDSNGDPVVGAVFTDSSGTRTFTTNSDGKIYFNIYPDIVGRSHVTLKTRENNTQLTYKFPFIYVKSKFPVKFLNDNIVKNKNNILDFKFLHNDYSYLTDSVFFNGNNIKLKTGGNSYSLDSYSNGEFSFNVPVGGDDTLNMELFIEGNDYIERYSKFFEADTSYLSFDDSNDLKTELESENSAKTVLFTGDSLDDEINIDNDVSIIFDGDCESSLDNVFSVNNDAVLDISNIGFTGKNLINVIKGKVSLKNNNFVHCTDTIIKGSGNLNIDNCGFIDNAGCVNINGDVNIKNTSFDISDENYVDTSSVPFLDVYGNLDFDFCDFTIDLHDLESLGYSYVMLKIGGDFQSNSVNNNLLKKNNQFRMKNNTSVINVTTADDYEISSQNNKAMTWNIVNTNTVYNNYVKIIYGGS